MDTPTADVFVHSLFARLLMLGDSFNAVVLKALQTFVSNDDNKRLGWTLLVGIMKRLKTEKANDIVQKALQKSEFISIAATAKGCTAQDGSGTGSQEAAGVSLRHLAWGVLSEYPSNWQAP
eukprot:s374_g20.t1